MPKTQRRNLISAQPFLEKGYAQNKAPQCKLTTKLRNNMIDLLALAFMPEVWFDSISRDWSAKDLAAIRVRPVRREPELAAWCVAHYDPSDPPNLYSRAAAFVRKLI